MSRGGRQPFGYCKNNGKIIEIPSRMAVARRIIELRDAGMKLQDIREDERVRWPDGRRLSLDTINRILKNRGLYDER